MKKIQKLLCIGIIFFNCLFQLHAAIAPTFYGKLVFHRYSDYEHGTVSFIFITSQHSRPHYSAQIGKLTI